MKNPFKRKSTTLQDLQQKFNQVMFELGDLHYRKSMIASNLAQLNDEINTRVQKANELGKEAGALNKKIQAEMQKTIATAPAAPVTDSEDSFEEEVKGDDESQA